MYWNEISKDLINELKQNIANPIVQTFVNHYKEMWMQCNLEQASKYITNKQLLTDFTKSYFAFQNIINEIEGLKNFTKTPLEIQNITKGDGSKIKLCIEKISNKTYHLSNEDVKLIIDHKKESRFFEPKTFDAKKIVRGIG